MSKKEKPKKKSEKKELELMRERNFRQSMSKNEHLILYQILAGNINFFKNQQWRITYYSVLIFAALISAYSTKLLNTDFCVTVLFLISTAVFEFGIYFICDFQDKLRCLRIQMFKHERINKDSLYWLCNEQYIRKKEDYDNFFKDKTVFWLHLCTILIGYILTVYIFLVKGCCFCILCFFFRSL